MLGPFTAFAVLNTKTKKYNFKTAVQNEIISDRLILMVLLLLKIS